MYLENFGLNLVNYVTISTLSTFVTSWFVRASFVPSYLTQYLSLMVVLYHKKKKIKFLDFVNWNIVFLCTCKHQHRWKGLLLTARKTSHESPQYCRRYHHTAPSLNSLFNLCMEAKHLYHLSDPWCPHKHLSSGLSKGLMSRPLTKDFWFCAPEHMWIDRRVQQVNDCHPIFDQQIT